MLTGRRNLKLFVALLASVVSLLPNYQVLALAVDWADKPESEEVLKIDGLDTLAEKSNKTGGEEILEELVINSNQELCQKLSGQGFISAKGISCDEVKNDDFYELAWFSLIEPKHYILRNVKLLLGDYNARFRVSAAERVILTIEDSVLMNVHGCLFTLVPEANSRIELKSGIFAVSDEAMTPSPFCVESALVDDSEVAQVLMRQILAKGAEFYKGDTNELAVGVTKGLSGFGKLGDKEVFYLDAAKVTVRTVAEPAEGEVLKEEPIKNELMTSEFEEDMPVQELSEIKVGEALANEKEQTKTEFGEKLADGIIWKITRREKTSATVPNNDTKVENSSASAETVSMTGSLDLFDSAEPSDSTKQAIGVQPQVRQTGENLIKTKTTIPKAPNTGKAHP